jgi:tetratricopeptide (TPR) repeat protein
MSEHKLDMAWQQYSVGQHESSIEILKELLGEYPEDPFCHALLAANLLARGRVHAAEYELQTALAIDPGLAFSYLIYARVALLKNKHAEARSHCEQALSLNPENEEAHLLISELSRLQSNWPESLAALEHASQLAPDSLEVNTSYGEHYLACGEHARARTYAAEALAKNAQDEDANLLMGKIELLSGEPEEAANHARLVILQNPHSQAALRLLAQVKMSQNPLMGLWWKFNAFVSQLGNLRGALVLVCAFVFFNLLSQIILDLGYSEISQAVSLAWVALVLYSWIGIPWYKKALQKELMKFSFNPEY